MKNQEAIDKIQDAQKLLREARALLGHPSASPQLDAKTVIQVADMGLDRAIVLLVKDGELSG